MKARDAHALKDQDLVEALQRAREEEFNLRLQHSTGELENTAHMPQARREVARLTTIARERGIDLDRELR